MTDFSRRKVLSLAAAAALTARTSWGAEKWLEGKHYFRIDPLPPQPSAATSVTEVFSYGCPGCNGFLPYMRKIEKMLPATVAVDYVPAGWIPAENWPLFQRAYLTASALGVARKAHEDMFAAVWTTGELAIADAKTGRPKSPLPSMQDVARFYQRVTAVPAAKFIETSTSFSVESGIKRADALIKAYRAAITPTLVVNGKYRLDPRTAGGGEQAVELVQWLVGR